MSVEEELAAALLAAGQEQGLRHVLRVVGSGGVTGSGRYFLDNDGRMRWECHFSSPRRSHNEPQLFLSWEQVKLLLAADVVTIGGDGGPLHSQFRRLTLTEGGLAMLQP